MRSDLLSAAGLSIVAATLCAPRAADTSDEAFVERKLAEVPDGSVLVPECAAFDRGGRHVAYGLQRAKSRKTELWLDDRKIGEFDFVVRPEFSPAGGRMACRVGNEVSESREEWFLYVDAKKGPREDFIAGFAWSRDGSTVGYVAGPGTKTGKGGFYDPDEVVAVVGTKRWRAWSGEPGPLAPALSPDGKRIAYDVMQQAKQEAFVVVNDQKGERYRVVDAPVFSSDGKHVAYGAYGLVKGALRWIVVVGNEEHGLEFSSVGSPVFAPKGSRLAFKALQGGKWHVAVDGKLVGSPCDAVGVPVFSPDGKTLAYAANTGGTPEGQGPFDPATRAGEFLVKGGTWSMVFGDAKGEAFDSVADPVFSPDASRLAYRARTGATWRMVVGDAKSEAFDELGPAVFRADGKRVAFGARKGNELWWNVMELD